MSDEQKSIFDNLNAVIDAFSMDDIDVLRSYQKKHGPISDFQTAFKILDTLKQTQSDINVTSTSQTSIADSASAKSSNVNSTVDESSVNQTASKTSMVTDTPSSYVESSVKQPLAPKPAPVDNARPIKYKQLVDKSYAKQTPSPDIYDSMLSELLEFDSKHQTYKRVTPMPKGAKRIDIPNVFWSYVQSYLVSQYGELAVRLFDLPSSTVLMFLLTEGMPLDVQQAFADAFSPQNKNTLRQLQQAREVKQQAKTTDEKVDDILALLQSQSDTNQTLNRKLSDVTAQLTSRQLSLIYALSWTLQSNNYTDEQLHQIFSGDQIAHISRFLVQFGDSKLGWLDKLQNDNRNKRQGR